jgi:hypothetical protein
VRREFQPVYKVILEVSLVPCHCRAYLSIVGVPLTSFVRISCLVVVLLLLVACSNSGPSGDQSRAGELLVELHASTLAPGAETTATAYLRDTGGALEEVAVTWSSSQESVATVTPDGVVQALAVGESRITARHEPTRATGYADVTVRTPAPGNPEQPAPGPGEPGEPEQPAPGPGEPGDPIAPPTPGDPEQPEPSPEEPGEPGDPTQPEPIDPPPGQDPPEEPTEPEEPGTDVASVMLAPGTGSVPVGARVDFQAVALDADGEPLQDAQWEFQSSAQNVLQVNADGSATASAVGTARVTATVDGRSATSEIQVTPASTAPRGVTWQQTRTSLPSHAGGIAVHREDPKRVRLNSYWVWREPGWVSEDPVTQPWDTALAWHVMAQAPSDMKRWYLFNRNERTLIVSDDNANSSAFTRTFPFELNVWKFVVSHQNAGVVYAATEDGVYRSANAGRTWAWAATGLPHSNVTQLLVDPTNDQVLYAFTHGGVSRSSDGGHCITVLPVIWVVPRIGTETSDRECGSQIRACPT